MAHAGCYSLGKKDTRFTILAGLIAMVRKLGGIAFTCRVPVDTCITIQNICIIGVGRQDTTELKFCIQTRRGVVDTQCFEHVLLASEYSVREGSP